MAVKGKRSPECARTEKRCPSGLAERKRFAFVTTFGAVNYVTFLS